MILHGPFRWLMALAALALPAGLSGHKPGLRSETAIAQPQAGAAVFRHYL